ncbi:MAG TPA: discoidin domain-containing protein [Candidatus Mediterraneibacter stercorigallinarum]|uniref:Discoidin domain-containing protein n=1 Tax=Candidatus Mediterraneibacter stercorigallinarum TaxID=2838686 RepID=A0A9D2IJT8_9FIRM|nr:discoidin domain-containing protein [Candidatus Mediterraneibacter stercorigallinarum]
MMKKASRLLKSSLAVLLAFACVAGSGLPAVVRAEGNAGQTPVNTNLAADKTVTASAEYGSMPASNLTDDDTASRWSTERDATQWAYVDLGASYDMNYFSVIWESDSVYASAYNIYVSDDTEDWGEPVVSRTDNASGSSEDRLESNVTGQYVKLEVTSMHGYPSVSASDFKVMLKDESQSTPQDPEENVALGRTGYSSSNETADLTADKAFDGDTSTRASRWSSNVGNPPHWLYVDLGEQRDVKTVRIFWETRKATNYEIQISDDAQDWDTVKTLTERPASTTDTITLDDTVQARYVRLYISASDAKDPDSDGTWNSISVYEMEVYGGTPAISMGDIGNMITVETPTADSDELVVNLPKVEGYTVTYNGTDLEQVIDSDLTIYHPVVDKTVNVSFKIVEDETEDYEFKEIPVTVPGQYTEAESDNAAPAVLPELQEWKGGTGSFTLTDNSRIVYDSEELKAAADEMAADFLDLTGREISVVSGDASSVQAGDFFFTMTDDTTLGLMDEGYLMDISDSITVTSETETGAYWATRTILQALKQSDYTTIPRGITRDYPLYKVRGFILDVGRKTFTLDYLEQVVKEMSWYKMNDFQVHLNDNLIGLENKEDPMTAYSAFRLENDTVKEGGYLTDAEGNPLTVDGEELQYEQDLTSTDLWYTKEEFKNFIQESRELGVNIVPEIDTPAHSLALTKVLPELRYGTSGRQNDHLDLVDSYDQCLAFVQTIFSEYLDEGVFDQDTIVHIGADEYNASSEAYRKFVNDMIDFVEETGRQARVWGSFTAASQGEDIDAEGVQINLWNFGYANMDKMYEDGFDLINCNDGNYYIVPNAGYYYDYLSDGTMYNLAINTISGVTIPAGDKQMVGGAFAVWNDMTDYLDNGVSEYDVYDRISNMSLFAAKLWGKGDLDLTGAQTRSEELGDAPRTNFGYEVDSATDEYMNLPMDELKDTSANNFAVNEGENASIVEVDGKNALELNGGTSYITTGLETAGLGNDLRVKVKRTSDSTDEQILFESPYGSIKAVQAETGKVGFSRERYDYSFNYTLPLNEWVELEFKNQQNSIQLYVNGELVDTIGDGERVEGRPLLATMMFPMSVIGSETNSFIGYVDDVRIGVNADFASTMSLDYAIWSAVSILDESNTDTLTPLIEEGKAVLTQYNPDAAEIARLTEELNNAVAASDYETADYSRIEAYKSLVTDLSAFTDESAANVTRVLESIRYGLPASMQDVVDGYEKALVDAIDALETKPLTNLYYVDQSTMTATASSYQQDGSNPSNVLDGNTSTMWHTNWNITTMPHWIDLQMSEPTEIAGLVYTPRQTGTNGNVTSYEIQVLVDGKYVTRATGTLPNNSETKEITFDPITTTNVRLVYNQAVNNNGSAAELQVVRANISADTEGLQAAVENAKTLMSQLDKDAYTEESWSALESVIAAAEELLGQEDPDANDVANMIYDIQKAVTELRLKDKAEEPDPVVDKTELYALLEQYGGYKSSDYTAETWKPFKAAYDAAKEVYLDESATQEEVDAAIEELARTGKALVKASEPTVPSDGDEQTTEKPPVTTPGTTVKTGVTETAGVIYAMALILSVGAISVLVWRRRVSK